MNTPEQDVSASIVFTEDDLLQLELRVAQRADKLSQENGSVRGRDLQHWLQAEREIFDCCANLAKLGVAAGEV
jgi:Protein of unknown function (DUF2934)